MPIAPDDINSPRFSRQVVMREMGAGRQRKLAESKVLIVGMGGLGCPAAQYLVAAGIGSLILVDPDTVELSNLNRQILFQESDVGKSKVGCAASRLQALSAATRIEAVKQRLDETNVFEQLNACDIVLDCSDNLRTRYVIGDACAALNKPCVSAAVLGFDGQLAVFNESPQSPCYRCAFPNPPDVRKIGNCAADGVIGAFVGVLGSMQALEAIKLIAKFDPAHEKPFAVMRCLNGLTGEVTELRIPKRPDCPVCGQVDGLVPKMPLADSAHSRAVPVAIDARAFRERIALAADGSGDTKMHIIDVRSAAEFQAGRIRGALHLPLGDLLASRLPFAAHEEVVLYCASGSRSLIAAEHLARLGFRFVVHLSGGMNALTHDRSLVEEGGARTEATLSSHHPDRVGGPKPRHCGAGDPAPA